MASTNQVLYSVNIALILISTQIILTSTQWSIDDDGCRTPDSGVGSCVPINECEPIKTFIQNSVPSTRESLKTVEPYYCGVENNSFKVCCPNEPIITSLVSTNTRSGTSDEPPDVTNHKNVNLLPRECGSSHLTDENKVFFGFPWMALLAYETRKGLQFFCDGTIINEWYILTAAHCLTNLSGLKLIGVRVGEYNISSAHDCVKGPLGDDYCATPVQDKPIGKVIPHPLYNSTLFTSDIGLIRLAKPIHLGANNAKAICLPIANDARNRNFKDTTLTVTGWGITKTGKKSEVLLKADVPVLTEKSCRIAYRKSPAVVTDKHICAGGQHGSDACGGDGGGPLQSQILYNQNTRYVQFGVVSFGSPICGEDNVPTVYTRVDYYMDWILDNMEP